ncbi:hypothetical protein IQ268_22120 [Oculatella sp. LEGE 06141]|uniref:hypothetical protein n=1 Tax=Oculatella sp. LEGE 06141 TaxID=1828648 RepID=UPI001882840D|nr:hypothetical protein [Oculatella sp. LEGE 06141]MBE9181262.1 hypothetical protein [Oculatella sp. LEGE 06141]
MKTDSMFDGRYLAEPTVFRPDFNQFQQLNQTQAWAMFFTASHDYTALGGNTELGRFFTNLLAAIAVAGAVGSLIYFGTYI